MDLAEFLLARLAEDEEAARDAQTRSSYGWADSAFQEAVELAEGEGARKPAMHHIARWDPARVLAECEAKRRIVELHEVTDSGDCQLCDQQYDTLRLLALPYADHPDYQPEWKP